jgi:hypothetical protein
MSWLELVITGASTSFETASELEKLPETSAADLHIRR